MTEEQAEQAVQELLDHPRPRDHNQALASLARSAQPTGVTPRTVFRELDPEWTPRERERSRPERTKPPRLRRFREVGATGVEPATFRPPARVLKALLLGQRRIGGMTSHAPRRSPGDCSVSRIATAAVRRPMIVARCRVSSKAIVRPLDQAAAASASKRHRSGWCC
jgi:hypothetical protein